MEERRKYPRLDTTKVNFLCKRVSSEKNTLKDKAKNISEGGICLSLGSEPVEKDDVLSLEFMLPERQFLISCKGKVAWVNEFEIIGGVNKREYEAGIDFFYINEEDKKAIREYVFSLMPKKPQP